MKQIQSFLEFLRDGFERGGFETEDVLAALLPLLQQVKEAHDLSLVAPFEGVADIQADGTRLFFEENKRLSPSDRLFAVEAIQKPGSAAFEIAGEYHQTADLTQGVFEQKNLLVSTTETITKPVYLPGYVCWEHKLDHQDQVTDIFSAGMMLASIACKLDFTNPEDLELFVNHRENLFEVNPRLNPVLASLIVQMTELDRHRRPQDLNIVIQRLKTYREQLAEIELDFTKIKGFREAPISGKRKIIQNQLKNRLFEITRRNRLLYFKPTLQSLNLTLASVPLLLDYRNIRPDQLFVWREAVSEPISNGKSLSLNTYLRFEDAPYLPGVLDKIISEARRDRVEFGFEQLRLVLCFLRWHNLKEVPEERIDSPLLLLPVELTKKKGVRDAYFLKPLTTEAEVNPVLRHHLKNLYGINLPEAVDLQKTTVDVFYDVLLQQIRATEPGVNLIKSEKPQIQLIHSQAKQRLDQYRRRIRLSGRGVRVFENIDYSYSRENYQPLGLQLFLRRIKPNPAPFGDVLREKPLPRLPHMVDASPSEGSYIQTTRQMYSLKQTESRNPYNWDFDLCNLTLGNFNYRKMTLVQDYSRLLDGDISSQAFDTIFSLQPKEKSEEAQTTLPISDQNIVISSDPTQTSAIALARSGKSYIIQGPPGTGKSQTITNLIADYVARGKRVLFVCEKRAAIDVVYYRLRLQGLDELCCLIHDSQTDKKEFISDLKVTYEAFLKDDPEEEQIVSRRSELVHVIDQEVVALGRFSNAMQTAYPEAAVPLRRLFSRLAELKTEEPKVDPVQSELLVDYATWESYGSVVRRLLGVLKDLGGKSNLASHALRLLSPEVINADNPVTQALNHIEKSLEIFGEVEAVLQKSKLPKELWDEIHELEALIHFAGQVLPLSRHGLLFLFNKKDPRTDRFQSLMQELAKKKLALEDAQKLTVNWKQKLPANEARAALEQSRNLQSGLAFLKPSYWKLRKVLNARYDFSAHAIAPGWIQILTDLNQEWTAQDSYQQTIRKIGEEFSFGDPASILGDLEVMKSLDLKHRSVKALYEHLGSNPEETVFVEELSALDAVFSPLQKELHAFLRGYERYSLELLKRDLNRLKDELAMLPDLIPLLKETMDTPEKLQNCLRMLPFSAEQLESAIASRTLHSVYRTERYLPSFDGRMMQLRIEKLEQAYREWLKSNAAWIKSQVRKKFQENVRVSSLAASQLDKDQKLFKRNYSTGRRELEHEFSKTMRYRSIRDLADGETGMVIRDLKPIWLMSPLSVSDTIPLSSLEFDVVIFDEASQIPLEEAIPALYRSHQTIVVGDEMQLPPTNFFSSARPDAEEALVLEEEGQLIEYELDADSFLTQSARNMRSTRLGWHYRSRYESLISFSNSSFYEGNLLTVPDRKIASPGLEEIRVTLPDQAESNLDRMFHRSISFHFQENGVYEKRSNTAEAEYIAQLVRGLFRQQNKMSIGIVAFSEAQQTEIESALGRLGIADAEFRNRLEEEYEREENGEFSGLFVKNLENVQGDERDLIILSICYGHDSKRKMLMNFGPINQRGGEKRLNVIFSRARHHMAVISSIRHYDITNIYNDGASCLRNFLEYSFAVSTGDWGTSKRILLTSTGKRSRQEQSAVDVVVQQLSDVLSKRGYELDHGVGQSSFKCDLAIRSKEDSVYRLGIIIDTEEHYRSSDVLERYLLRPGILKAFGWQVALVLTKDWYHDAEGVLHRIERLLSDEPHTETVEEVAVEDAVAPEPVPEPEPAPETMVAEPVAAYGPVGHTPEPPPAAEPESVLPEPPPVAAPEPLHAEAPVQMPEPEKESPSLVQSATTLHRYFEYVAGNSNKYWEVQIKGTDVYVHFGRIGTKGQTQIKSFNFMSDAEHEAAKLIREKVHKGYQEKDPPK